MVRDTDLMRRTAAMDFEHSVYLLLLVWAVETSSGLLLVLVLQFLCPLVFQALQHSTVITLDHHLLRLSRGWGWCRVR